MQHQDDPPVTTLTSPDVHAALQAGAEGRQERPGSSFLERQEACIFD